MDKQSLIYTIKNIVDPNGQTARFHPQQVANALELAYGQMLYDFSFDEAEDMNYFTKEYTEVDVSLDATTNRYYSTLPAAIVQMPRNRMAVRHINTEQGTDLNMFPMTERQWELLEGSDADTVMVNDGDIGYFVRYPKVWYYNMSDSIETVRMVLVVPFSVYSTTDEILIPAGKSQDLIRMTLEILGYTQSEDLLNKNEQ